MSGVDDPTAKECKRAAKSLDNRLQFLIGKKQAFTEGRISMAEGTMQYMNEEIKALKISLRLLGEAVVQRQNEHLQRELEVVKRIEKSGGTPSKNRMDAIRDLEDR